MQICSCKLMLSDVTLIVSLPAHVFVTNEEAEMMLFAM